MKKHSLFVSFLIMAAFACQQQAEVKTANAVKTVDITAEQAAVNALISKLTTAFKEQDVDTLAYFLTEDALVFGSDPSEFFNKQQVTEIWKQMLAQPVEFNFIGEPVIKVAPDGSSAFALHQYYMPMFSEKLQFRNDYHLIKMNSEWKILAFNTACIPKNEDFTKINETLSK